MIRNRLARLASVAFGFMVAGGCAVIGPIPRSDIIRVSTFYDKQNPWLNFDTPPRPVPGGVRLTVYLSAPDRALGVFGDGVLRVEMYSNEEGSTESDSRNLVRQWRFSTEEAFSYRARHESRLGWGYSFRLDWGDVDVLGREIILQVAFERSDGRTIYGQPMYMKVPQKA